MTQPTAWIALTLLVGATVPAQTLTPAWAELGDHGRTLVRVVVQGDCPALVVDNVNQSMEMRRPVPDGFQPLCEAVLPATAKFASLNGRPVALPGAEPSTIAIIGDTGCRIKGDRVQACNDPGQWPFAQIAARVAAAKPKLVMHVGDYLYREDACPAALQEKCGGSPFGDHWSTWNADFFTPAAPLLAAAPWVFARGNHEDCQRAWRGWFYYLDPRPWDGVCHEFTPPYEAAQGTFKVAVVDSSAATEGESVEQAREFARQLESIQGHGAWFLDHHPVFGLKAGGPPAPSTPVLAEAWKSVSPRGIPMLISGHTHLWEVLSFRGSGQPVQLVAGDGGTDLAAALPPSMRGLRVSQNSVANGFSKHEFGYTWITRSGSRRLEVVLRSLQDQPLATCRIDGGRAKCKLAN